MVRDKDLHFVRGEKQKLCADLFLCGRGNLNSRNRCEKLTALLTGHGPEPTPPDCSLWAEDHKFAISNFQYALHALKTGDNEVVTTIAKWAGQPDHVAGSACAEWCTAVEKILSDKAKSWSTETKAAITEMLNILSQGNQAQSTARKNSPSKK